MIRMRHHLDSSGQAQIRPEANEIILINSHDGATRARKHSVSPSAATATQLLPLT